MKTVNRFALITIIFLVLCLACIVWLDRPIAVFVSHKLSFIAETISPVVEGIELVFGFQLSKYLFGFILLLVGFILFWVDKTVSRATIFFFIAVTHIVSRLTAGVLKNVFLRLRPYEYLATGDETKDFWISGGSSFPSGHTVHFFGLFLPLLVLYPNQKWWLILPVFVGLSRILENDHYLSDVVAAVYIAYFFTYLFARLFKIREKRI